MYVVLKRSKYRPGIDWETVYRSDNKQKVNERFAYEMSVLGPGERLIWLDENTLMILARLSIPEEE